MAILDQNNILSDKQAITATAASTNVIDFLAPGTPLGAAGPIVHDKAGIPFFVQVVEAFNNLTSLTVEAQVDNDEGFGSPKTVYSETIALADLVLGKKLNVRSMPYGTDEQYFRLLYTVTGSAPTTGKITTAIGEVQSSFGTR